MLAESENPDIQARMASYPVRVDLRLTTTQGKALDEWRRRQPDLPSRQDAVRQILDKELGLVNGEEPAPDDR